MSENRPIRKSRYLVFSSVGDSNNINCWLSGKLFDLWVVYYGDDDYKELKEKADFFLTRKAGKLQNFYYVYKHYKDVISQYEAVILADDDIVIRSNEIHKLFASIPKLDVKAIQPSYLVNGKNSYKFTETALFREYRITNFVEIGFVAFETNALLKFMEIYDPIVNCWGVDWWISSEFQKRYGKSSLAILDSVSAYNPHDIHKRSGSEIEKLYTREKLAETWENFSQERGIETDKGNFKIYYSKYFISFFQILTVLNGYGLLIKRKLFSSFKNVI